MCASECADSEDEFSAVLVCASGGDSHLRATARNEGVTRMILL